MEFKKILQTLKNTIKGFLALTLILSFSLNLAAAQKKKKKDPTFAIGIGMVAAAAGVVAFCALNSPASLSNQANNLGAISRAAASQQQAPTETRPGSLPPPVPIVRTGVATASAEENLSCLQRDEWNMRAFRVTALRYQLHNAALSCRELSGNWNRLVVAHGRTWSANIDQIERYFGSRQRGSVADNYTTDLANYLSQRRNAQNPSNYCSEMRSLYQQVEALPNSAAMVQFAVSHPQPLLSPCR